MAGLIWPFKRIQGSSVGIPGDPASGADAEVDDPGVPVLAT